MKKLSEKHLIRQNELLQSTLRKKESENYLYRKQNENLQYIIENNIKKAKTFRLWQKYCFIRDNFFKKVIKPKLFLRAAKILVLRGPRALIHEALLHQDRLKRSLNTNQQYKIWLQRNYPKKELLKRQVEHSKKFSHRPKISIITPTYNTPTSFLRECINSVLAQSYDNWELCIVDDASKNSNVRKIIKVFAGKDKRIKYFFRSKNGHICRASNDAIELASGDFIGFLDHDDILWPNALFETVKLINNNSKLEFIYCDEDKIEEDGVTHADPFFKPDWSPDYLGSINYITHFTVIKKKIIESINGFRVGYEGAQDWDLFLRATQYISQGKDARNRIGHIPTILYSWRKSLTSTSSEKYAETAKRYAFTNQIKVLSDDLVRRGYEGDVVVTDTMGLYYQKYEIRGNPKVSIIIPTKDKYDLISSCIKSIINRTHYHNYEIIIVDTGTTDSNVLNLYNHIAKSSVDIRILNWNQEFNFAAVCNLGAQNSKGEHLLFLNNDIEAINPDWLENMLQHSQRAEVGAVGAKLIYKNGLIQHAGVILGMTGLAGHIFQNTENSTPTHFPFGKTQWTRNYLAVTAACLMIKKKVYDEVGGMQKKFQICGNDVDLCLRLYDKGYYNIYTSNASLYHYESQTRDINEIPITDFKNSIAAYKKYLKNGDPFFNPNLSLWFCDPQIKNVQEQDPYEFSTNYIETLSTSNTSKLLSESLDKQKSIELTQQQKENFFVASCYDFTHQDLIQSKEISNTYRGNISISSANWFIPSFTTPFAGIINILRFAAYLQEKGIQNTLIVDSPYSIEPEQNAATKKFPVLNKCQFIKGNQVNKIRYSDVSFATLWTTAYQLLKFNNTKRKIYFMQDYESLFYPASTEQSLVENTYYFNFPAITNIKILESIYKQKYNGKAYTLNPYIDFEEFLINKSYKSKKPYKIFFYARPDHLRNGFELGLESLKKLKEEFGREVEIYTAGSNWNPAQFGLDDVITNLGILSLSDLPSFYHSMDAGLFLMFSAHPGVVPFELMASSCPVVININSIVGWTDIYKHNENCVLSYPTASEISNNLRTILTNQDLRAKIIPGGLKTVNSVFSEYQRSAGNALSFITNL